MDSYGLARRLNLRSGEQLGRIYRVYHENYQPKPLSVVGKQATELLPNLASENAAVQYRLIANALARCRACCGKDLRRMAVEHPSPAIRTAALGVLRRQSN